MRKFTQLLKWFIPEEFTDASLLKEKYGDSWDDEKYRKQRDKKEKQLKKDRLIMKHGKKKYAEMMKDAKAAKDRSSLKDPRGVKFFDAKGSGYIKGGKKKYN